MVGTLTILPLLDGKRKTSLVRFFYESRLVKIIDLHEADLSHADLREKDLSHLNLSSADLSEANLHDADLSSADLSEANLQGANLKGATVTPQQLEKVKSLRGATMPDGSKHFS